MERPSRITLRSSIVPIVIVILGLGFALVPLAQGRMFFYWDNAQQHYAQTVFLQDGLQQGAIPHWWPGAGLGFPTTAEGQAAHYHPIRLLSALLFSAPAAMMWELAIYFCIAGLATFFFLRQFRLHRLACLLGAGTHMFCGFAVIYVRNVALHRSFCLLPLAMLCAEWFVRRGGMRSLAAVALVIGVQFLSGHPSFAIVTVVATAAWVLCRVLQEAWKSGRAPAEVARISGMRLAAWMFAMALGMGVAGIQVAPTLLHAEQSQRQGGLSFEFATGSQPANVRGLGQLLFPYTYEQGDWMARPQWWGRFNNVASAGMYCGVLCILLAPVAIWWRRRWPDPAVALAISGVLAIGFALGAAAPLFPALWSLPGMNGLRFPSRFLLWAAFCLSCLSAVGLHRLMSLGRLGIPLRRRLAPVAITAAAIAMLGVALWLRVPASRAGVATSLAWFAAAALVLSLLSGVGRRLQFALCAIAVALGLADLWSFRASGNYARSVPIADAVSVPSQVEFLRQDRQPFRVLSLIKSEQGAFLTDELRDFVQADLCTIWGIDSTDVFLSLFLKRHFAVRNGIVQEILERPESARLLARFLGALNVKYLVAPRDLTLPGWDQVHQSGQTSIWKNASWLPRAFLAGSVAPQAFELNEDWRKRSDERLADYARTVSDWSSRAVDAQLLDHVMAKQIDYGVIAEVAGADAVDVNGVDPAATVTPVAAGADEMRYSVTTARPAFLVVSSSFYPGWTATVDGQPARIFQTNWITMGVAVPGGQHDVVLRFTTPGYRLGMAASAASLLVVGVVAWRPSRLRRRLRGESGINRA